MQKFINNLILKAGKILKKEYGKSQIVEQKHTRELVTETDKKINDFLISRIRKKFPRHQIISEESDIVNKENKSHIWYIDPIDGTTNFIHNIPVFGISIGYEREGQMENGTVYFPILNELFYAEQGKGSFKNKKQIYPSKREKMIEITAGTGFCCIRAGRKDNNLKYFNRIVPQIRGIRRIGAASYDLCCVACARLDAYWEMELKSWDIMAGKLIVEEAGGRVTDFSGGEALNEKKEILATNGTSLHEKFIRLLKKDAFSI